MTSPRCSQTDLACSWCVKNRKPDFDDLEPCQHEPCLERIRCLVDKYRITDIDGIAGKISRVGRIDHDALVWRNAGFDRDSGFEIERRRMVHKKTICQRAKTGIDVVETRVCQPYGQQLNVEKPLNFGVRFDFGSESVAGP